MRRLAVAAVVAGALVAPAHADPVVPACVAAASAVNDRCETWSRLFNDPARYEYTTTSTAAGMAVRSSGDKVYVASTTGRDGNQSQATIAALSGRDGGTLWVAHPPTKLPTASYAVALSPDQRTVVVAGTLTFRPNLNAAPLTFWLTTAYSAMTGRVLWTKVFDTGGNSNVPVGLTFAPRGDRLFVLGYSVYGGYAIPFIQYVTIAYSAKTGKQLWLSRFSGTDGGQNTPSGIAVSPKGDRVFVTGRTEHPTTSPTQTFDYGTVAYDARTGRQVWRAIYRVGAYNAAAAIAVNPRGGQVFVTGTVQVSGSAATALLAYATLAYDTRTGKLQWAVRETGGSGGSATPSAIVASPDGKGVYVTGASGRRVEVVAGTVAPRLSTYTTLRYDTKNGAVKWRAVYSPQPDYSGAPTAMGISRDGSGVYVSGVVGPPPGLVGYPATVAYVGATGAQKWVARFDVRDPASAGFSAPVAVTPAGSSVFVSARFQPVSAFAAAASCGAASTTAGTDCKQVDASNLVLAYGS